MKAVGITADVVEDGHRVTVAAITPDGHRHIVEDEDLYRVVVEPASAERGVELEYE